MDKSKKIGLVCNYYIMNYGSALQCYATYKYIKELGYNIKAIRFPNIPTNKAKREVILRLKLKRLLSIKALYIKLRKLSNKSNKDYIFIRERRSRLFKDFIDNNIEFTQNYNTINELEENVQQFDIVMLGSDQLLNPRDIILGYHTLSFVPDNIKKVSYAASFGLNTLPKNVWKKAQKELGRLDSFSAREMQGVNIYKELTRKQATLVVDPTLLLSRTEWDTLSGKDRIIKDKYIYCHFLGNNLEHRNIARELKKEMGIKLAMIKHADDYIKADIGFGDIEIIDAGPCEFINIIKNAEYVITDSFHATIFSIIFSRQFWILNRFKEGSSESTNSRIDSITSKLGLKERRINSLEEFNINKNEVIDYNSVYEKLDNWIGKSKDYLVRTLE